MIIPILFNFGSSSERLGERFKAYQFPVMVKIGGGSAKRLETRHHHPDVDKIHAYVQHPANSYFIRQVAAAV